MVVEQGNHLQSVWKKMIKELGDLFGLLLIGLFGYIETTLIVFKNEETDIVYVHELIKFRSWSLLIN